MASITDVLSLSRYLCGSSSRDQALVQLEKPAWADLDVEHDVAFVAHKLDYRPEDLDHAMKASPLWYTDFPHRERLLGVGYNCYRFLTGRRKASNF